KEAGAEVELYYISDLKINPCLGDLSCWLRTPGECIHKDDMEWLAPKIIQADILILASPVHFDGVTGSMKILMDRLLPGAEPFFEIREGHMRHPHRQKANLGKKLVLVSSCGFWEMDNFDPLLVHLKAITMNTGAEFAGALLRPHGPALKPMIEMGAPVKDILEAAKDVGRQIVCDGKMSPETLNIVSRELMPRDMYIQSANQHFREELEKIK
ncbi:MAG TPA: flavodoxin family protein, partial [Methanosarcina sp.]|nr:flavodoxin family protein [Methanosarcina sp.]